MKYCHVFFAMCLFGVSVQGCGNFWFEQQLNDSLQKQQIPGPLTLERNGTPDRFPGQKVGFPRLAVQNIPLIIAARQAKADKEQKPQG